MTRDEIASAPASREMDVNIGYHVMGLVCPPEMYPNYSTNISDAWQVVEKMMRDGFIWKSNGNESCGNFIYSFSFAKDDDGYEEYFKAYDSGITEKNLSLAICRAALLAQEYKK
jgi:hypothetical protein